MLRGTIRKLLVLSCAVLAACGGDPGGTMDEHQHDPADDHHHEGTHGGELIELGDAGHLEVVHDAQAGTVRVFASRENGSSLLLTSAPQLKLSTASGPTVLSMAAEGGAEGGASEFSVTDAVLKTDPLEGRIAVTVDGVPYSPPIPSHDHE